MILMYSVLKGKKIVTLNPSLFFLNDPVYAMMLPNNPELAKCK